MLWQSWEFIAAVLLLAGTGVFVLDRYRAAKLRQIRSELATSLESERTARENEMRFRTLAQTASDAIITIDLESRIVFVNDAVEEVFGYTADELIGEKLTILIPQHMRQAHRDGLRRYSETGRRNIPWNGVELPGRHKSGAEVPLEVSFGEFEIEGERYFTGVARNISKRKLTEEALRRAREDRLKELQKVRARIATDLHDDIGSSLTQIAVMSEVARRQTVRDDVRANLERISDVSNELVDVMSDIVWAINPKKDNMHELTLRMRRFASDLLSAREIDFEFDAVEAEGDVQLGANIRREVFSIYKECINNIVRHSGATYVDIVFQISAEDLRLRISDNGHGFDTASVLSDNFSPNKGGNGLVNMRRRAHDLGGGCDIISLPGNGARGGTATMIHIPLHLERTDEGDFQLSQSNFSIDVGAIHVDSVHGKRNKLH